MNYRAIFNALALLIALLAVFMLPSLGWSLWYHDGLWLHWIASIALTAAIAAGMYFKSQSREDQEVLQREALTIVGLGWLFAGAAGAIPFLITRTFTAFHDAFFETISGFTTTGSTVLIEIESIAPSVLFWRSMTHWLGGIGIIVLFIAVMPFFSKARRRLYRTEIPGVSAEGLTPRIKQTAIVLIKIYLGMTVAETVLLMFGGMTFFDALCHTFGTVATGGFSTKNNSVAHFDSVYIESVIIVFMILAGSNLTLLYFFCRGRLKIYFQDSEFRTYIIILLVATGIATLLVWFSGTGPNLGRSLRDSAFTVVSIMTSTGFCTANFSAEISENIGGWPLAGKALLVMLMFIGACGGSTGGGLKVIRYMVMFKVLGSILERSFSPRTVRQVKIGGRALEDNLQFMVLGLFFAVMIICGLSTLLLVLWEPQLDLVSAFSAVAATANNIGPGLYQVGAVENFAFLHPASKFLLSICMIMGRLEFIPLLVLIVPNFWRVK